MEHKKIEQVREYGLDVEVRHCRHVGFKHTLTREVDGKSVHEILFTRVTKYPLSRKSCKDIINSCDKNWVELELDPYGGHTEVKFFNDDTLLCNDVSICCNEDIFNKSVGFDLAMERCLNKFLKKWG